VTKHANPDDDRLRALLTEAKTIAVVGASSKGDRPSNGVMRRLAAAGYRVIPVNPNEQVVLGEKSYPTLEAVPDRVDIVDVFRRAELTPPIARSAVAIGARVLWLQEDVVNEEAARIATDGGLEVVMDACIGVVHSVLRVPAKR